MNIHSPIQSVPAWVNYPHCEGIEFDFSIMFRGVPIGTGRCAVTVADYGDNNLEPVYFAIQSSEDPDKWVPVPTPDPLHPGMADELRDAIRAAFYNDDDAQEAAAEGIAEFIASHFAERRGRAA